MASRSTACSASHPANAAAAAADADLVVFPEATMATFARRSSEVAEPLDGPFADGVRRIVLVAHSFDMPRASADQPSPIWAGFHRFNGNGEMTGTTWIEESGFLEGPVMITNTHSVGVVRDAVIEWGNRRSAGAGGVPPESRIMRAIRGECACPRA